MKVTSRVLAGAVLSAVLGLAGCGEQNSSFGGSSILRAYVAWGDSLTAGNEGYVQRGQYPEDLQGMLAQPFIMQNEGIGGQTSTQIGVREGGISTTVTVLGGVIPASGSVQVEFPAGYEPITGADQQISASILGVPGTVASSSTLAAPVFTRTKSGDSVSATDPTALTVDTTYTTGPSYIPLFWEGRNDPRGTQADAQATIDNISKQVAVAQSKTYLVMSIINGNYTGEIKGTNAYNQIISLNNALASTYSNHYLDIRSILVGSYDPASAVDVSDYNNDEPPTSLRAIFGTGVLAGAIGPGDTTLTVNVTAGYLFGNSMLTIGTGVNAENVRVVAVAGNTATVTRNAGGNNQGFLAGTPVSDSDVLHLNAKGYLMVANAVDARIKQQE